MKRIKEYLNKHVKLKRIAKILGVVAIVFSFLFNALIIGSLIINSNQQQEDNTTQVLTYGDYKPVKNSYYYTDDGYYVESRDIFFTNFISNFLYKTYPVYDDRVNNVFITDSLKLYVCGWYYFGSSTPQGVTTIIQEIWVEPRTPVSFNTNSYYLIPMDITFYGYLNNEINFEYTIVYDYIPAQFIDSTGTLRNNYLTTGNGFFDFDNFSNVNLNILNGYIMFTRAENLTYFDELIGLNDTIVEQGYISGYQDGYNNGKSVGYEEGYEVGSTGMTSNPFNLISNAFTSIASILNIQVLPNLTLGVLIFTPLIVTIIVVVVKFMRG